MKKLNSNLVSVVAAFIGLYLLSAGASWAIFTLAAPASKSPQVKLTGKINKDRGKIDPNLPRTEACPINGQKYTTVEKSIWDTRRPIAAMIENHADSRPAQGLSKADVIYEAVAEGGITRFLAIFYCGVAAEDVKIAPVRSARIYYINWASEYADFPIYLHVGGANNYSGSGDTAKDVKALETLETIGWRVPKGNDFDTTYDSQYPLFWRDPERLGHEIATEHQMTASIDQAYLQAEKRGFGKEHNGKPWTDSFVPWTFIDDKPLSSATASKISFKFWNNQSDYDVEWQYDSKNNQYLRVNGGKPHVDLEYSNVQLAAKNVVIQKVIERGPVDRNKHMFYQNIGTGKALIFQNGDVIEATWQKRTRDDRTKFLDSKGKEIPFVRGQVWIEAIPSTNEISYN